MKRSDRDRVTKEIQTGEAKIDRERGGAAKQMDRLKPDRD